MTEPTRYPLTWPQGRARTAEKDRKPGMFRHDRDPIRWTKAYERLEGEMKLFHAAIECFSCDLPIGKKGGRLTGEPLDPGVAVWFKRGDGRRYVLACDSFDAIAQNCAAIAAHIEATRAIERYGVATAGEMLESFAALPAPGLPAIGRNEMVDACNCLGVSLDATATQINAAYRTKVRMAAAGELAMLNVARDLLLKHIAERAK